jgi:dihydropteroate synthase
MPATRVMGIVNITPDSFSDGGRYEVVEDATRHAFQLVEDGADVLDIGAESTRPGAIALDWETEWARLEPVLRSLVPAVRVPVSVDTYHVETAERAIALGVQMINDISACADPRMATLVRQSEVAYVYMHNRSEMDETLDVTALVRETEAGVQQLLHLGVAPEQIYIDPGVGFAKTRQQDLACIREVDLFCQLGYPVLLGTSRKRVIGSVLNLPVSERLEGNLATVAYALLHGVQVVRVHDVKETVRVCRMLEAIVGGGLSSDIS